MVVRATCSCLVARPYSYKQRSPALLAVCLMSLDCGSFCNMHKSAVVQGTEACCSVSKVPLTSTARFLQPHAAQLTCVLYGVLCRAVLCCGALCCAVPLRFSSSQGPAFEDASPAAVEPDILLAKLRPGQVSNTLSTLGIQVPFWAHKYLPASLACPAAIQSGPTCNVSLYAAPACLLIVCLCLHWLAWGRQMECTADGMH